MRVSSIVFEEFSKYLPEWTIKTKPFSISKNTATVDMLLLKFIVTWSGRLIHFSHSHTYFTTGGLPPVSSPWRSRPEGFFPPLQLNFLQLSETESHCDWRSVSLSVLVLLSCPWEGALSDERTGLSFVSQPAVLGQLSVCTIFTFYMCHMLLNTYKASVSPGSVQQIMPYFWVVAYVLMWRNRCGGPHRKHRLQQFYCCVHKHGCGHMTFTEPLPSNGRLLTIPAFSGHATVYFVLHSWVAQ
jgi:hypothetical protein